MEGAEKKIKGGSKILMGELGVLRTPRVYICYPSPSGIVSNCVCWIVRFNM